jgi:tRNA modification GTPase
MNPSRLVVSQLTPAGRGAIASVLVAGSGALQTVGRHFTPASGKRLESHPAGGVVFGTFRGKGDTAEDLVVAIHGPERVDVHCHGGVLAATAVVEALRECGAAPIPWQEAAHLLEDDPIAAEARIALAAARTEKTAALLLSQYHGALGQSLQELIVAIERGTIPFAGPLARLRRLLALAPLGLHLTRPWRVVIAGAPNVGKSSLMNALVGYQRSIVFAQPGTTRDLLSATTALEGWPLELLDTAGLRESDDPLEAAGIARARTSLAQAELILLVRDVSDGRSSAGIDFESLLPANIPVIVVCNKADLLSAGQPAANEPGGLLVSARTGAGLERLCRQIVRLLVPILPERGEAIPFTQRQQHALQTAIAALERAAAAEAIGHLEALLRERPIEG